MELNEEHLAVFNAAIDLYTNLLFEQKEVLFRIIDTTYSRGYEDARRDIALAMQQQAMEEHKMPPPPEPYTEKVPEKFSERIKAAGPRR